ncbi:uncharacterized protein LOC114371804 [Glycine soja]|uniref:uncharacterized protein LOC114371804 n=1 Tax=Glycine soja TaxID=3848 RepID=UPI00103B6932|nr:uncharacterized protein LOC114371804 [Glycine soja]
MPELLGLNAPIPSADDAFEGEVTCIGKWRVRDSNPNFWFPGSRSNKGGSGGSSSMNSEEYGTMTTCLESQIGDHYTPDGDKKVLNLFI